MGNFIHVQLGKPPVTVLSCSVYDCCKASAIQGEQSIGYSMNVFDVKEGSDRRLISGLREREELPFPVRQLLWKLSNCLEPLWCFATPR